MDIRQLKMAILMELDAAKTAQSANLIGRARVCCRRAAAQAIVFYYAQNNIPSPPGNALQKIAAFRDQPEPVPGIHTKLAHLLLQVNAQFQLPGEIELLQETRELVEFLINDKE